MPRLEFTCDIAAPVERVWEFYDDVRVLPTITPPWTKVRVLNPPDVMRQGCRFTLVVRQSPLFVPLHWETIITVHQPPRLFVDEQGKGPFAYWRHEHHFDPLPGGTTRLRDVIDYRPPFGIVGGLADHLFIRRRLEALFAHRHQVTRQVMEQPTAVQ
jgi:ligand-binding SRPBCC domain-containing protein